MDLTGKTVVYDGPTLDTVGTGWVLSDEYEVRVGTRYQLVCPEGMPTDGASIPRFFWRLLGHPMEAPYVKAAVIHDAGYRGYLVWRHKHVTRYYEEEHTRSEVDLLFRALLKDLGMGWCRRNVMYRAVRWFGGSSWTKR